MKIIAKNKRARFDYEIKQTIIAGVVLTGQEVKSAKAGHMSLKGSFISLKSGEAYLTNAHISPYKMATTTGDYNPTQSRKLLLHRRELSQLQADIQSSGLTAVPLGAGIERGLIKIEIGVGRGKKHYDKRQTIKKRDMLRDANIELKPGK